MPELRGERIVRRGERRSSTPQDLLGRRLELWTGRVLNLWVIASLLLLAAGLILALAGGGDTTAGLQFLILMVPPAEAHPLSLINVCLIVLLASPVVYLLLSLVRFALERDFFFVAVVAVVLGILAGTVYFSV